MVMMIRSPSGAELLAYVEVKSSASRTKDVFEVSGASTKVAFAGGTQALQVLMNDTVHGGP
jgi:hypothetical protein